MNGSDSLRMQCQVEDRTEFDAVSRVMQSSLPIEALAMVVLHLAPKIWER